MTVHIGVRIADSMFIHTNHGSIFLFGNFQFSLCRFQIFIMGITAQIHIIHSQKFTVLYAHQRPLGGNQHCDVILCLTAFRFPHCVVTQESRSAARTRPGSGSQCIPIMKLFLYIHIQTAQHEGFALIEKIHATASTAEQTQLLHDAEEMLLADMPVIPILFNENATLTSKSLSGVDFSYYGTGIFSRAKLKNWEAYVPAD